MDGEIQGLAAGVYGRIVGFFPDVNILTANTYYRLVVKPTTANNITVVDYTFASVALMDAISGGQYCHKTERTDAGAWTDTTTRRPWMGFLIDQLDDGVGGSGGGMPILRGSVVGG